MAKMSAKGTTLKIASGTGGAKNITGMVLGNPTILTSAAHGFSKGDVVTFAALAGNTTLNGQTLMITHVTTNTFAVNVDTTGGSAWTSGGTATPVTYTQIKGITSYTPGEKSRPEIDTTDLESVANENMPGIPDSGSFSFEYDYDSADAGQQALETSYANGTTKGYQYTLPNAQVVTFNAWVSGVNDPKAGVNGKLSCSAKLRITGAVSKA